jgi:hypothetical protein
MLHHLRNTDIDKKKWDECIDNCPYGMVYVLSWWLDIVCPGWEALVDGDYETVMPLPVKQKWGLKYLIQPYFCQQLGVFSKNNISEQLLQELFSAAKKIFSYIFINLNYENHKKLEKPGSLRHTHYIRIDKNHNDSFYNYSESHKKNLRRAGRNELSIKEDCTPDDLMKILGKDKPALWNSESLTLARKIMDASVERKCCKIYGAFHGKKMIGGAFFAIHNKRIYFMCSSSTSESVDMKAMFLLTDQLIKNYAASGFIFDMMGSMIPGVAYFNEGFGAEKIEFSQLRVNRLPFLLKIVEKIRG